MKSAVPSPQELGALLRLLAHDLRNPLSAIDSNLSFLEGELTTLSESAGEAFDDMKLSCDGVSRIVESVELLGRFLQGKVSEEFGSVPIGAVLRGAGDAMRPAALSHGVTLMLAEEAVTSTIEVVAGREMLVKALRILVHNAIQHAPQGSDVQVSLRELPEDVVIQVLDRGSALDPSLHDEAFTASGQLKAKQCRGGRYGAGLGLFCARTCAQAAGAHLRAVATTDGNRFELSVQKLVRR